MPDHIEKSDSVRDEMERIYTQIPPAEIPWNIESPPRELVRLVETGQVKPCKTIELGCGAGNYAIYLAGKAYIHCLATDSHDSKSRNASQVQQTARTIEELIGPRNLQLISRENPIRVLRNEALESMEKTELSVPVTKRRRWRFWQKSGEQLSC